MKKSLTALGLAGGLVVGGLAGVVIGVPGLSGAQSAEESVSPRGDHSARLAGVLAPLVEDGTLTQEQADKVIDALKAERESRSGGIRDRIGGGIRDRIGGHLREGSEILSQVLGLDQAGLVSALMSGQSVAQIAEAQGVDLQVVIDALVAEARTHTAEAVESGRITQEQADEKLADVEQRITEMVQLTPPTGGLGGFGGPGGDRGGRHGGMGGSDAVAES